MFHAKEHFCKNYWVAAFLGYNSLKWPRFCKVSSQISSDRLEGRKNIFVENFILPNSDHEYSYANSHIFGNDDYNCIGRHHNLKKPSNTFIYWLILSRILCPGHDQEEIRRQLTTSNDYIFDLGGNFLISFLPCHLRSSAKCKKI